MKNLIPPFIKSKNIKNEDSQVKGAKLTFYNKTNKPKFKLMKSRNQQKYDINSNKNLSNFGLNFPKKQT